MDLWDLEQLRNSFSFEKPCIRLWESNRALRQRAIQGKTLLISVDGSNQPAPSLQNITKNYSLLKGFTQHMSQTGVICTNLVKPIKSAVVAYYDLMQCDVTSDQGISVCHGVSVSIKKMLRAIRTKWRKWEMPRVPCIAIIFFLMFFLSVLCSIDWWCLGCTYNIYQLGQALGSESSRLGHGSCKSIRQSLCRTLPIVNIAIWSDTFLSGFLFLLCSQLCLLHSLNHSKEGRSPFIFKADKREPEESEGNQDERDDDHIDSFSDHSIRESLSRSCSLASLEELRDLAEAMDLDDTQQVELPPDSQDVSVPEAAAQESFMVEEGVTMPSPPKEPSEGSGGANDHQKAQLSALLDLVKSKMKAASEPSLLPYLNTEFVHWSSVPCRFFLFGELT